MAVLSEVEFLRLQLRRLYEETPALLHAIDGEGRIELVSNAWLEHFGYSRNEVIGRRSSDFLDEKSKKYAKEVVLPAFFASGVCRDISYTWVCKDGSTRDVLLSATYESNEAGEYVRSLAVLRDVTFQRASELRAERERALLEQVFESASDAFILVDEGRRVIRMNRAAEKMFQWTTEEVAGQSTKMFYTDDVSYEAGRATNNVPFQTEYLRRDGSTFVGETVGDVIRDEAGLVTSRLGVIRDVTEEVERHKALEKSNERLERSLETLDQFAYVASHDLRTPLRGIQHVVRFLEEDSSPEVLQEIQPRLDQLRDRTDWMDRMLEGLLRFARKGHLSVTREDTDLKELLDSIENMMQMGDATRQLVLTRDFSGLPSPVVRTNTVALRHILSNLLSNAVAHHDRDIANVSVACEEDEAGLCVRVTDDGPGIEPRHQERVFDIFRTLTVRGEGSSSGMGLTLVRRLAHRIGGTVRLVSPVSDGRGCCFEVQIPNEGKV